VANIIARRKYPGKTRENPVWFLPVVIAGSAVATAIAGYYAKKQVVAIFGGSKKATKIIPPLIAAGVNSFVVRPRIGKKWQSTLDLLSLGLVGFAGVMAVLPDNDEEKPEGKPYAEHGVKGVKAAVAKNKFFNVTIGYPGGAFSGESYPIKITNVYSQPLKFYYRVLARPGHDEKSEAMPFYAEVEGPFVLRTGETLDTYVTRGLWGGAIPGPSPYQKIAGEPWQYKVQVALNETFEPDYIYTQTGWYNYWSDYK
jgi:hypothetical protein